MLFGFRFNLGFNNLSIHYCASVYTLMCAKLKCGWSTGLGWNNTSEAPGLHVYFWSLILLLFILETYSYTVSRKYELLLFLIWVLTLVIACFNNDLFHFPFCLFGDHHQLLNNENKTCKILIIHEAKWGLNSNSL